jgi:phosphatidylglycerol:prolipoprotein diacylglycerol transferase
MHRILLQLGGITVYSYGFMLALAFITGTYLAQRRARREGVSAQLVFDLIFYALVSSIIGARAFFVAVNWDYYAHNVLEIFKLWEGGLVFYGGFIVAFLVVMVFLRAHRLPVMKIADIVSPSLAIGISIGRIGCFLNGCCYGKLSPQWGVSYPASGNPPAFAQQLAQGLIGSEAQCSLPVLPTQLYESLSALVIFMILLWLEKRKRFQGVLFWVFLLLFSLYRCVIESFRYYDSNFVIAGSFTVSQAISALLALTAAAFLIRGYAKAAR